MIEVVAIVLASSKHPFKLLCMTVTLIYILIFTLACTVNGAVKLVGGQSSFQGRLEVCLLGVWGTVCESSFDNSDARVACQQLGYSQNSMSTLLSYLIKYL